MKRLLAALLILVASPAAFPATITIINKDAAGVGFNDPTPAVPVGGNAGTTLGQQRLNAFQYAAGIWGAKLSSPITIKIAADFSPLTPCSPGSGVIGSAGASRYIRNFTNAPRANTWYPIAQASALSGVDQTVTFNVPDGASIIASFNSNVGTAGCLTNTTFYLGLDANEGTKIDLVATLLHEFGHGLGFAGIGDIDSGNLFLNNPDIYAIYTRDNTVGLNWNVMSEDQRLASATNNGNVVFDGPNATAAATTVLTAGKDASQHPKLFTPNPIQGGSSVYHYDVTASPNQLMEPAINHDLTHNVDVPNDLTTKALADMGWPMPVGSVPPTNVVASATSATSVNVTWTAAAGATSYRVYRTPHNSTTPAQIMAGIAGTTFTDNSVSGGRSYIYTVRAFNGSTESADSNRDLATTVIFTDPTLTSGTTAIKAAHFTELRTAANSVRTLAGLGAGSFTDGTLDSTVSIKALHLTDIRTSINAARTVLSLAIVSDPGVVTGTTVAATPITALRAGVQ